MSELWRRREFLAAGTAAAAPRSRTATAKGAVIAAESEWSARAATEVLKAGGNAIDAAAAASLACSMTEPHMVDLGGYVAAAVVRDGKTGKVWAVDAGSTAPAAASPGMFEVLPPKPGARGINENEYGCSVRNNANVEGALAAGVPSTLAGVGTFHERWGRLPWARIVAPSQRILSDGFRVTTGLAEAVSMKSAVLGRFPASAAHLMPGGRLPRAGDLWHRPDMQRTLRRIAAEGWRDFYRGDIGRRIVAHVRSLGGILSSDDLAGYQPLCGPANEVLCGAARLYTAPLPNGGLTCLSGALMLHRLGAPRPDQPAYWHLLAETLKIAWRDRLRWFGDPAHGGPAWQRFTDPEYIERATERLRREPERVGRGIQRPLRSSPGTVHISAADREGNLISVTISHGGYFGSGLTVPETGITLGHGMCRFDPHQGLPNSVAPGKRPLNNTAPMLLRQAGRDAAFGLRGGRRIVSVALSIARQLLLGRSGDEALREPRLHTEGDEPLEVEESMPARTRASLERLGHKLKPAPSVGGPANVAERASGGELRAASTVAVIGVDPP